MTRNGTDFNSIIGELSEIEEIRVNGADPSGNGSAGGDNFEVIGDFTATSLRPNTITIAGSSADDTIDISGLCACANSAVMPHSIDTFSLVASAAPVCGPTGVQNVAVRRAAIETINRGYDKFVIMNAASRNNVRVRSQA